MKNRSDVFIKRFQQHSEQSNFSRTQDVNTTTIGRSECEGTEGEVVPRGISEERPLHKNTEISSAGAFPKP